MKMMRLLGLTALTLLASLATASLQIVPGATWTSLNTGVHLQAHGAGIIQVGGTYYMIGEDKTSGSAFQNVNCYSSTDLVQWTYVGALLSRGSSGDLGPNRVVERPKVLFNSQTNTYVLWMHIDDSSYGEAKVGVATGSSVCGQYSYKGSWRPLGFQSRDMSLFQDSDGSAYLLSEDRANGLRIDRLTNDYLNVSSATYLWPDHIEAPAMVRLNGRYYMFGSHLTGWSPNDNVYSTATSLSGPWSSWANFAPSGSNTFSSQTNFILPYNGKVIYMGDRWVSSNLMNSTYIWLPLSISGTSASMSSLVNWLPTTFQNGPTENNYLGSAASLSNGAKVVSCPGCTGSSAAGYLGGPSNGKATFNNIVSSTTTQTTIRIYYENGDSTQRFAYVSVNGGAMQRVAFLPSANGNTPMKSVFTAQLNQGSSNSIVIQGYNASYAPDIDYLAVPMS